VTLDASGVALRFTGNPRSNGVLLGALAALSGEISIEAAERAILHRFGERAGTGTAGGARAAFELLQPSAVSSRA
jgi:Pyruvate/2-oxoacid:ferredoxin oxidoreductase gamma subunit